jgi:radical SAM superfamily enzyme YgiQ (UPF0313 family)
MNALLVYPKYPDTFWSFSHVLKFISKKAAFPPLGLLTVAAMMPDQWNKKLIDLNICELTDADILWSDMVFISAMLVQQESVRTVIGRCNTLDKKIVVGGPAFDSKPELFEGVDHFVSNEAEITFPLFLKDLENNTLKKHYSTDTKPDITITPIPLWSLIDMDDYATMCVQYSRGCPFDCEFCDIVVMNGRIPRTKTAEQILLEFEALYAAGWKEAVFIVDDNFIGNKNKVKMMLPHLIAWQKAHHYPFTLMTEASINLADDDELMRLMSEANFSKVFLGIETPSLSSLKECGKLQNTQKSAVDSVRKIHENGMQVMGGFIVGFDSDSAGIFQSQIEFIQKMAVVTAMVGILTAIPKTRLYKRLDEEGRILADSTGENTDGTINFIPKMGKKELITGYKRIISTIYSPKQYYRRINALLKQYRPTVKMKISMKQFKALVRSFWRIGIVSRSRFYYWKLLLRTSFTRTKSLPVAVELAIYGIHFEKIAKQLAEN